MYDIWLEKLTILFEALSSTDPSGFDKIKYDVDILFYYQVILKYFITIIFKNRDFQEYILENSLKLGF